MPSNPTPEERLLRLIRGEEGKEKSAGMRPAGEGKALDVKKTSDLKFDILSHKAGALRSRRAGWLNQALIAVFVAATGWAFYEIAIKEAAPFKLSERVKALQGETPVPVLPSPQGSRAGELVRALEGRALFKPAVPDEDIPEKPEKSVFLKDLAAPLALMGVEEGPPPLAMIQDRKSQQTYFLHEGDLLGEIRISRVRPGVVTLEYDGEQMDLRF
ncbi:MAG: hypothetical protein HYY14_00160 [Candidatus Omnitrophica bacterium]|nr:hypothetical protein [Candidatus Omnitrophota bacterium]